MSCTRKAAIDGSLERVNRFCTHARSSKRITHHSASTEIYREDDPTLIDAVMGPSVWKHTPSSWRPGMTPASVSEFIFDHRLGWWASRTLFTLLAQNLSQSSPPGLRCRSDTLYSMASKLVKRASLEPLAQHPVLGLRVFNNDQLLTADPAVEHEHDESGNQPLRSTTRRVRDLKDALARCTHAQNCHQRGPPDAISFVTHTRSSRRHRQRQS